MPFLIPVVPEKTDRGLLGSMFRVENWDAYVLKVVVEN
jgi:hypothetical protein